MKFVDLFDSVCDLRLQFSPVANIWKMWKEDIFTFLFSLGEGDGEIYVACIRDIYYERQASYGHGGHVYVDVFSY